MAITKSKTNAALVIIGLVAIGMWYLDSHFDISYNPNINGPQSVADKAKTDAEKAYKTLGNKAWDQHYQDGKPLSEVQKALADQEILRQAREIVAANAAGGGGNHNPGGVTQQAVPAVYEANLPNFRVQSTGPDAWEFQLSARDSWQKVGEFDGPGVLEFSDSGLACSKPDPCAGPNGHVKLAKFVTAEYEGSEYPIPEAMCQALGGTWDLSNKEAGFQIGDKNRIEVPAGHHALYVTDNIKEKYRGWATGGHGGTFTYHKK